MDIIIGIVLLAILGAATYTFKIRFLRKMELTGNAYRDKLVNFKNSFIQTDHEQLLDELTTQSVSIDQDLKYFGIVVRATMPHTGQSISGHLNIWGRIREDLRQNNRMLSDLLIPQISSSLDYLYMSITAHNRLVVDKLNKLKGDRKNPLMLVISGLMTPYFLLIYIANQLNLINDSAFGASIISPKKISTIIALVSGIITFGSQAFSWDTLITNIKSLFGQ